MSGALDGLTPVQAQAASHTGGPLVLRGPAGAGRTRALVARLAWLVEQGERPESVVVLAPDPARAEALRELVEAALGDRPFEELAVATPAGFALRLLREEALEAGLDPLLAPASTADRLALLLARVDELPLAHHDLAGNPPSAIARILTRIDAEKAAGTRDRGAAGGEPDLKAREEEFALLRAAHDRLLSERGQLDVGDLVLRAHALLVEHPGVRARVAERYGHVLVDDHHDLSAAQARLVGALVAEHGRLTATLDPDQRLSPAAPPATEELERLRALWPGELVELTLGPSFRHPEHVTFWRCTNERAQAQAAAAEVERLLRAGATPDRVAVLVQQVRGEGRAVALALEERAIDHQLLGAEAFFGQAEVLDVLAWLRLLLDPGDAAAVVRALVRPPVELRSVDLARCVQISRRRKLDLVAALHAALESPQLPPEARDRLLGFLRLHRQAAAALDTTRPDLFLHRLVERLGMRRQGLFAAQPVVVERLVHLARLGELAGQHARRHPQASARDWAAHITAVAEAGLREEEAIGGDPSRTPRLGAVAVLGMQATRGREFDHVLVLGLDRSRLPEKPDGHSGRLLGVAMTRARRSLVLAYAADASDGARRHPSPFAEAARTAADGTWEEREEELFGPDEALHATFTRLRDELLGSIARVGGRIGELRLDTDLDVAHGVTRYLELVKLAALLERPAGQPVADALADVNARLLQSASAQQREAFLTSGLDEWLMDAERDAHARVAATAAREEPSLEAFLPRRGDGLVLSASDIETYRACPLKYKFARVFRIPQEPTMNQRFGILVHQVLERWHAAGSGSREELLALLDVGWRRGGFGDSEEERQFRAKTVAAMHRYVERDAAETSEPVWLEKGFQFTLGRHVLRGRVDRVDKLADGGYELIDYKTGRPRTQDQLKDDVQLSLYAVAARAAWDVESSSEAYHYVLDDEKVRVPAVDIDRDWIAETVARVAEGIEGQGFEPTPSVQACGWCDYRIACPVAER